MFTPQIVFRNVPGVKHSEVWLELSAPSSPPCPQPPRSHPPVAYPCCLSPAPGFTDAFLKKASLSAPLVENPPAMRETWVQVLGWEDPLEKGYAICSSILELPLWLSW